MIQAHAGSDRQDLDDGKHVAVERLPGGPGDAIASVLP
jgi:hypothetical protein